MNMLENHTYTHKTIGPFIYLDELDNGFARIKRLRDGRELTGRVIGKCEPWMHPQPERLREMAAAFEEKAKNRYNVVDFGRSISCTEPWSGCGTAACHGGWAGQVLGASNYYLDGARALGHFLCPWWKDIDNFPCWAFGNPELWGNLHGCAMFTSEGYEAFGFEDAPGKCTLLDIADHYRQVAARIEALL